MVRSVIWAVSALSDLEHVIEFISQDSPAYATSFYDAVKSKAHSLSVFSKRGRVVPEFNDDKIRAIFVHRYRMIYQVKDEQVIILSFIHGAREL